MRLRIAKFFPSKLYGFVALPTGEEAFFHAGGFSPGKWEEPLPIPGEEVELTSEVEYRKGRSAPRISSLVRVQAPTLLRGIVESFNPEKGWGFALGEDQVSYYIHRSEFVETAKIPHPGGQVRFYAGFKNSKARACYIEVL